VAFLHFRLKQDSSRSRRTLRIAAWVGPQPPENASSRRMDGPKDRPVLRPGVYDDRETADFIAASVVRGRLAFQLTERCIEK
jgi:hypothetical protein